MGCNWPWLHSAGGARLAEIDDGLERMLLGGGRLSVAGSSSGAEGQARFNETRVSLCLVGLS